MKILLLSSEDPERYGGSQPHEYRKIAATLEVGGFSAIHRFVTTKDDLLRQIAEEKPKLVFSGVDCTQDSDGNQSIADILDAEGIPYVGSNSKSLKAALHKDITKRIWEANGIKIPEFFVFNHKTKSLVSEASASGKIESSDIIPQEAFPLIVKPMCKGGSRGITDESVVYNVEELSCQVLKIIEQFGRQRVLAEKFISDKREFTVSIIGNGPNKLLMPSELVPQNGKRPLVLTHEIKDGEPGNRPVEPEFVKQDSLRRRLSMLAAKMFDTCGLRDYARADIMMDSEGSLYGIEINGQTVFESYFLTGPGGVGMDYTATVNAVIYASILRHQKTGCNFDVPLR